MRKKAKKEQDWQAVNDQRAGLRHRLNAAEDKLGARPQVEQPPLLRPAKKGDTVTILKTGTPGEVLSSPEFRSVFHLDLGEKGGSAQ